MGWKRCQNKMGALVPIFDLIERGELGIYSLSGEVLDALGAGF